MHPHTEHETTTTYNGGNQYTTTIYDTNDQKHTFHFDFDGYNVCTDDQYQTLLDAIPDTAIPDDLLPPTIYAELADHSNQLQLYAELHAFNRHATIHAVSDDYIQDLITSYHQ